MPAEGNPAEAEQGVFSTDESSPNRDDHALRAVIGREATVPRTQKAQLTQKKLLDAAATVFASHGYEATRVSDITSLAGVAHGSFYRYFTDKDSILQELLLRLYSELGDATRAPGSADASLDGIALRAQLEDFNVRFFQAYARRRGLLRVAREAAASAGEGCFREIWFVMRGRFIDRTRRLIERLQAQGFARELDPVLTAEALGAMSEQMAYVLVGLAAELPDDARLTAIGKACNAVWERTLFPSEIAS